MLNKILTLMLIACLGAAAQIKLVRGGQNPVPYTEPPNAHLTLKMVSEMGTQDMPVRNSRNTRLFRDFPLPPPMDGRQDLNILVLKVEFVEDDETCTTGDGKMDLTGFGTPEDGLFYDPPHSGIYFERQMQFLSNYYNSNSFGNQFR